MKKQTEPINIRRGGQWLMRLQEEKEKIGTLKKNSKEEKVETGIINQIDLGKQSKVMNESELATTLDETEINIPTSPSNIDDNENVRKQTIKRTWLFALMDLPLTY